MTTATPIQTAAKKSNTNLTIMTGLAILALIIVALASFRYIYNLVAGPFPIEASALAAYEKPTQSLKSRVTVQPSRVIDTGYRYTSEKNGNVTTQAAYHVMQLEDKYLLVKFEGDRTGDLNSPAAMEGNLRAFSKMERENVYAALLEEEPSLNGLLMPFLFDATSYTASGWGWIAALVVLVVLALLGLLNVFKRSRGQFEHPIYKNLARYGDPQAVSAHLDEELSGQHEVLQKHYHFTPNWFAFLNGGSFDAVPYQDLLWYYMHTLTQKRYGITVGHTHSLMMGDRQGKKHSLMVSTKSEEPVLELMEALNRHAPWAIRGYSPELEQAYNKDRQALIAEVDRAYQEYQQRL